MKKIEVGFWNHTTRAGLVLRTCWHGGSRSICKGKSTPAENNIIHTIGGEGHREGGRRMSLTNPNGWQNEVDSKRISGSALTPGTSLTEDFAREKTLQRRRKSPIFKTSRIRWPAVSSPPNKPKKKPGKRIAKRKILLVDCRVNLEFIWVVLKDRPYTLKDLSRVRDESGIFGK